MTIDKNTTQAASPEEAGKRGGRTRGPAERRGHPGGQPSEAGTASITTSTDQKMTPSLWELSYGIQRARLYHEYRRGFMVVWHRFIMFLIVLTGSGAAAAIASNAGWSLWLALASSVLAAMDLVFGFHEGARLHESLYRRLVDLESDLEADSEKIDNYRRRLHAIEADEPPVFNALNALCQNEVNHTREIPQRLRVPVWARLTKQLVRHPGRLFPVIPDRPTAA